MSSVTVIIPNRNYGQYLYRALSSVYNQTVKPSRVMVVDGESSDCSYQIARKFTNLDWITAKPRGQGNARNVGISQSNSEFILPLDSDDYISRDYIERCLPLFDSETGVVAPDLVWGVNGDCQSTLEPFDLPLFLDGNRLFTCSMFRKKCWEDAGGYQEGKGFFEDWLFWAQIAATPWKIKALHEPLFHYCIHDESSSSNLPNSYVTQTKFRIRQLIAGNRFTGDLRPSSPVGV